MGFPGGSVVKNHLQCRRPWFDHWVGKILWKREWQPTPVFLPGESHEQRSLVATVHGVAESDTTERQVHELVYFVPDPTLHSCLRLCPLSHDSGTPPVKVK